MIEDTSNQMFSEALNYAGKSNYVQALQMVDTLEENFPDSLETRDALVKKELWMKSLDELHRESNITRLNNLENSISTWKNSCPQKLYLAIQLYKGMYW